MKRSAGRGVSGGGAQPSLICFTVRAHPKIEKAVKRKRNTMPGKKSWSINCYPSPFWAGKRHGGARCFGGHRGVIAFPRLILMAPFQSTADDFVWGDSKRQQSRRWIRPFPISIIFNLMRDTSRWRGPHAQMHHYHSTRGISSKLLTGQTFSLATVGKRRRGHFSPATRQAAAHPHPHHIPLQASWRRCCFWWNHSSICCSVPGSLHDGHGWLDTEVVVGVYKLQ